MLQNFPTFLLKITISLYIFFREEYPKVHKHMEKHDIPWESGGLRHTWGVTMLKMLLKLNKALCLPVHQSGYGKQLKKRKFA